MDKQLATLETIVKAQIEARRLRLEPYEPSLLQPSSIDVRLDRWFRVFNNQQYTHIDPSMQQDDLTTLVEPKGEDPFVLRAADESRGRGD